MDASFDFRSLRCFASTADAQAWSYLPRRPDVQRAPDGRPLLTLIDMGVEGYLVFTATWAARADDVAALRDEIARREPSRGSVTLSFAMLSSPRCDVLMGDGRGTQQPVASNGTSGFPPYDAAFNLHLKGERLEHARAALRGESGRLGLEYGGLLQVPVRAKALLRAASASFARFMGAQDVHDRATAREALERAVDAGIARVTIDAPDAGAGALASELYDRVLDRAAELVPRVMQQLAAPDFQVSVELEQATAQPTSAFADIGTLVQAETTATPTGGHDAAD